jgi:lysophospholipase L1-like esterase
MIARASLGGDTIRVRLSNAFGAQAVTIGSARVALHAGDSRISEGTDRALSFSGRASATLHAGQTLVSDPVALRVAPLSDLAVSLYIAGESGPPTSHTFGLRPTYVSAEGDFTAAPAIQAPVRTMASYYWLAGIDVLAPLEAGTLVTFGDSITDGDQSTPGALRMWPALLAARLQGQKGTARIGVVNAGISGNRLLGDNNSGLARLASHALSVPGVKWITLLEGINDITAATRAAGAGAAGSFSADDLIAGYRQVIAAAHVAGVRVIGCTLTPFGGSTPYTDRGEAIRQAVNTWILKGGEFDAVIDFDAATRDRAAPARFRPEADSPDLLHPGDSGYRLMADAVDLGIFSSRRRR